MCISKPPTRISVRLVKMNFSCSNIPWTMLIALKALHTLNNGIAYHMKNRSVNNDTNRGCLTLSLARANSSAGGLGNQFSILISHRHFGDTNPPSTLHHTAFSR